MQVTLGMTKDGHTTLHTFVLYTSVRELVQDTVQTVLALRSNDPNPTVPENFEWHGEDAFVADFQNQNNWGTDIENPDHSNTALNFTLDLDRRIFMYASYYQKQAWDKYFMDPISTNRICENLGVR